MRNYHVMEGLLQIDSTSIKWDCLDQSIEMNPKGSYVRKLRTRENRLDQISRVFPFWAILREYPVSKKNTE